MTPLNRDVPPRDGDAGFITADALMILVEGVNAGDGPVALEGESVQKGKTAVGQQLFLMSYHIISSHL